MKKNGFTLIETLVYIGLFSFIMTGTLVSIYAILSNVARNQTGAMVMEEGLFLSAKLDWLIKNEKAVSLENGNFVFTENGKAKILNNSNVKISCDECFAHVIEEPERIEINFTISTLTYDGLAYERDFSHAVYLK